MTKQELMKKIGRAGKIYGTFENITVIDTAVVSCNPENGAEWKANGFYLDGDILHQVEVNWDFSEEPGYEENEDAVDLPWENENLMSVGYEVDNFDLSDSDDITRAARCIEK